MDMRVWQQYLYQISTLYDHSVTLLKVLTCMHIHTRAVGGGDGLKLETETESHGI